MAATRPLNKPRRKKPPQAFYEPPSSTTSAQIISEARRSVRALPTERPFTPADSNRNLFGSGGTLSRPPSVYSIGARHFSTDRSSRPSTAQKLAPIERTLASDPNIKLPQRRVNNTPPTPVQSFQDLSVLETPNSTSSLSNSDLNTYHHSSTTTQRHGSTTSQTLQSESSRTDLESTSSGTLQQDQTTQVHGRRSSSAGRRGTSAERIKREDNHRALSAGERKTEAISQANAQVGAALLDIIHKRRQSKEDVMVLSTQKQSSHPNTTLDGVSPSKATSDVRQSRKSSTVDLPVWDSEITPLLSELECTPYENVAHLCEVCATLWSKLEQHRLLGRSGGVGGSKRRAGVLRTVFKLLDHKDPNLLLKVARIIVAMKVTGKNLLNVCKLLFTLSKDEKNDELFKECSVTGPVVELLLTVDLLSDYETIVYGLGTVKLLASNHELREQLASAGVMRLMANNLKSCTDETSLQKIGKSKIRNILVQLTGALRNLSDASSLREEFLSTCIIPRLSSVLSDHMTSSDVVFNISRLLSKLTLQCDCQAAVLQCPSLLPLFLQALTTHADHADIIVRVCFILGNLTSDDADTRHLLLSRHSAMPKINAVFSKYFSLEQKQTAVDNPVGSGGGGSGRRGDKKSTSKPEDVLIKLVRVVANMSVHPEVGPAVAEDRDTVEHLLLVLAHMSLVDYEELVLNSLATLNNLSYYAHPNSCIVQRQEEIANLLLKVIVEESNDGLLECTRVYGNLSRYSPVREILGKHQVTEMMVTLLDSGKREVVYSACGVLINLMVDSDHRDTLTANKGIRKLIEVLHDFGHGDWQLASLVCKTLWNYSEKLTSSSLCFGQEETDHLLQILETFCNESNALNLPPNTPLPARQLLTASWQGDFLPVAQALVSRIKAHHTELVPLEPSSKQ